MSEVPESSFTDGDYPSSSLKALYSPDRLSNQFDSSSSSGKLGSKEQLNYETSFADSDTSGIYFPYSKEDEGAVSTHNLSVDEDANSFRQNLMEDSVEIEQMLEDSDSDCQPFRRSPYQLRSSRSSSPIASTSSSTDCTVHHDKNRRKTMLPQDFNNSSFPKIDLKRKRISERLYLSLPSVQECEEAADGCAAKINNKKPTTCHQAVSSNLIKNVQCENDIPTHRKNQNYLDLENRGYLEGPYILNINVHVPHEFPVEGIPLNVRIIKEPSLATVDDKSYSREIGDNENNPINNLSSSSEPSTSMNVPIPNEKNNVTLPSPDNKPVTMEEENSEEIIDNFEDQPTLPVDASLSEPKDSKTNHKESLYSESGPSNVINTPQNEKESEQKHGCEKEAVKIKKGKAKNKPDKNIANKKCKIPKQQFPTNQATDLSEHNNFELPKEKNKHSRVSKKEIDKPNKLQDQKKHEANNNPPSTSVEERSKNEKLKKRNNPKKEVEKKKIQRRRTKKNGTRPIKRYRQRRGNEVPGKTRLQDAEGDLTSSSDSSECCFCGGDVCGSSTSSSDDCSCCSSSSSNCSCCFTDTTTSDSDGSSY